MRDWFVSAAEYSVSFATALSLSLVVMPYLWDWVLVRDEVTLPRSGSVLGR